MISRWYELKERAIKLRKKGCSFGEITALLGIPRSTLSGWFRRVKVSKKHKEAIYKNWLKALARARVRAVHWHNQQKEQRLIKARLQAQAVLEKLNLNNPNIIDLALAFLYLGEGSKKRPGTSIGSSDPLILKFFLTCLRKNYNLPVDKIRCYLHLRSDQDPENLKKYWSKELNLPLANFNKSLIDKRTAGRKTYQEYKGVCLITCGKAEIQRKLMYLANGFCEEIIKKTGPIVHR